MLGSAVVQAAYRWVAKPLLFRLDAERAHEQVTAVGSVLGRYPSTRAILGRLMRYEHPSLEQSAAGLEVQNPIGLAAGFDYDGYLAPIMAAIGFGFSTVGTVTWRPSAGNAAPRLGRLPRSRALLVNKGLKSSGALAVRGRLRGQALAGATVGVSVAPSNVPEVDAPSKAVEDCCSALAVFQGEPYVRYFELNVSCPNAVLGEVFCQPGSLERLLREVQQLGIAQPVFLKMPGDLDMGAAAPLISCALGYGVRGVILSNLTKSRSGGAFDQQELASVASRRGNFSGRPTFERSNQLIAQVYQRYGRDCTIIGCGGVFSAGDAYRKVLLGASFVQLVTGLVFEGPQLIGQINVGLARLLERDGYRHVGEAVGASRSG